MGEKIRHNLQPYVLSFDRQAPETRKIPRADLRRWRGWSKAAFNQSCMRPGKIGGRAGRTRKSVTLRMIFEDPVPLLSRAHGFNHFGNIGYAAAMRMFELGIE